MIGTWDLVFRVNNITIPWVPLEEESLWLSKAEARQVRLQRDPLVTSAHEERRIYGCKTHG